MTTPPEPAGNPGAEEQRITTIAEIRTEQQRQAGVLDRLESLISGGKTRTAAGEEPVTVADPPPGPDMQQQMMEAIRAVNAERDQAAPKTPAPETPPREPGKGRDRLARVLFGKAPDRALRDAAKPVRRLRPHHNPRS